jgi:hypothetical protein
VVVAAAVVAGGGGGGGLAAVTRAAGATDVTATGPYSVARPGSTAVNRPAPWAAKAAPNADARAGVVAGGKRTSAARVGVTDAMVMPGDAMVMTTDGRVTPAAAATAARNLLRRVEGLGGGESGFVFFFFVRGWMVTEGKTRPSFLFLP